MGLECVFFMQNSCPWRGRYGMTIARLLNSGEIGINLIVQCPQEIPMNAGDKDRLFALCLASALLDKARGVMPVFDKASPAIKKGAEDAVSSLKTILGNDQERIIQELSK